METHVSSTTADVPETQEVIGSHGNVELVIVVEKLDEEQPNKADSNSQDNVQPTVQENKSPAKQSKKDSLPPKSPSKQESVGQEVELSKPIQTLIKIQRPKQSNLPITSISGLQPLSKLPEKHDNNLVQNTSTNEQLAHIDVDSTSIKSSPYKMSDEVSKEKDHNITVDREASNDSQTENCDVSEKEQNKSISRELKSLINSAKESKIISECTKVTTKTRKSKAALDTSNPNLNNVTEAESIQGTRRSSSNSQKSNCSEKSEKVGKRSMRSQNPEFVNKVKQFLNSVTGKFQRSGDSDVSLSASDEEMVDKSKDSHTDNSINTPKGRNLNIEQNASTTTSAATPTKSEEKSNKLRSDPYCWRCHWSIELTDGEKVPQPPLKCTVCPRSFHYRCLTGTERTKIMSEKNWVCPECMTVLHAESSETRSSAMKKITLGMLCELLKFALQRMTEVNGAEPFMQPVDRSVFPDYDKYVVHPMDLSLMREHISEGLYGSTEAFLADVHWILHNSIIFNTMQSKLTAVARALVRSCRVEMGEIEACPECYSAAHARRATWFTDVCSTPHLLLWAKLKGFPYWPAKAMSVSHAGLVDVRFFGAHDRAWVPARDCFLYSEKDPNNFRTKRQDIIDSMQEAEQHIRNISRKYGKFVYAPFRVQFEPAKFEEQLKLMIPSFEGTIKSPVRERRSKTPALVKRCRSSSKGSKDDVNAGDEGSDREVSPMEISKADDGPEKMKDSSVEKSPMVANRKRGRSEAKESTGGAPDSCSKPKRKRAASDSKQQEPNKTDSHLVTSSKQLPQHIKQIDYEMVDESKSDLDVPECQPSVSATPTKPVATPKVNKETPKTTLQEKKDETLCQSNKITTENALKPTETEKTVSEAKSLPQTVRVSRSSKSRNNSPSMEVEQSGADSSSSNTIDKTPTKNGPNKPLSNSNKNVIKAPADTPNKTNEQKIATAKSPLVVHGQKGDKTEPTKSKIEKVVEPVTTNKKIENEKAAKSKNNETEKVTNIDRPNKNNEKEKVSETGKEKNKGTSEVRKESHENTKNNSKTEKTKETTVVSKESHENIGNSKTVSTGVVSSRNEKAIGIDSTNKSSENNSTNKKVATDKDKSVADKDKSVADKDKSVADKDKSVADKNKSAAEKDKSAADKAKSAADKDKSAADKDKSVADKDKSVADKDKSVAEKDKSAADKDKSAADKDKSVADKDKTATSKSTFVPKPGCSKVTKSVKDRVQLTEDTNAGRKVNKLGGPGGSPTVSGVRGASSPAASSPSPSPSPAPVTRSANVAKTKTTQITVEVNPDSSIFTPTSTDNVRNMKEAVNKLEKLRTGFDPPPVGRVGVRSFARMRSPEQQTKTNDVLVEIKSEPMDFEETEAPQETPVLDFLRPRPVPPVVTPATLREVRINKVVAGPTVVKKAMKPPDARPRAKKTFPQPKKPDDGRSELTNKNSMVYIPIQPPMSQAPVPVRAALKPAPAPRTPPLNATNVNVAITSIAPPLLPMAPPPPPAGGAPGVISTVSSICSSSVSSTVSSASGPVGGLAAAAIIGGSPFPTVPTTVHTVPLITSVNGQWTFSLQPVMSVGGVDNITSPMVNGVGERAAPTPAGASGPATVPGLVPTARAGATLTPVSPSAPLPTSLATSVASVGPPASTVNRPNDAVLGEPPRLTQRPVLQSPLAASTPVGEVPAPSAAGPLTAKLNQNSIKLADFFRTLLEDSLEQLDEPAATTAALRLQLEQARWKYQHELSELRHTHELLLVEVRAAMEKEKARAVAEARRLAHLELDAAVKHAKSKQWCANCSQEAQFYCCWNTSYCDYPCQRAHWAQHYSSCTQQRTPGAGASTETRARPAEPAPPPRSTDVPKTTSAPTLTVGGKLTTRIVNLDQAQKSSIVVSATEEATGRGAVQCPAPGAPPATQLTSSDDGGGGGKRMVTSGGYLIVGTAAARRAAPPSTH